MKIIYLSSAAIPNDWAHVLQIMKMSEALGRQIEVEVVVPRRKKSISTDPYTYYHIEKSFKIREIPCIDLSHESPSRFVFLLRTFSFLLNARLTLNQKDTVIYTREPYASAFFSGVVYELHSLPKKVSWYRMFLWKRVGSWVVLTDQIRKKLISFGISTTRIHVEPDAVDLEKFNVQVSEVDARTQCNLPPNTPIIGYVGTLKTMGMEKGVGVAIHAMTLLPSSYRLCIVGGEKGDILFYENMASELGVRERVIFVGKVEHAQVPLYIKACTLVVAPFPDHVHYRYYMSPLKIFEYMASRRTIITSDLESIREVLDETNAVLTKPGDSAELANAIHRLIEQPQLLSSYADAAFAKVQEYTWNKRAQRVISFIKNRSNN